MAIAKLRPEILIYKLTGITEGDTNTQEKNSEDEEFKFSMLFGYAKKRGGGGEKGESGQETVRVY